MKTILILGGGIGGIVTANKLRNKLNSECKIVLIDKNPIHSFAPSFIWLATGKRKAKSVNTNLQNLLMPGIELVIAEIQTINTETKLVKADEQNYRYDFLIIALGAELVYDIPGLTPVLNTFYSLEGSIKLHEELKNFKSGNISVVVCSLPYKCPGAPHEGMLLISDYLKKRKLRENIGINFYTPEFQPMQVAGPNIGKAITEMLQFNGINFFPLHKLTSINTLQKELIFENGVRSNYDLLIVIPPHKSPKVVQESNLTNKEGWIPVNSKTLETKYENVFAIGDITTITIPGTWKKDVPLKLPKAGVFAHSQAEIVAKIIISRIHHQENIDFYNGEGYCVIETGNGKAGFSHGNFYGEPHPIVEMKTLKRRWHWGKVIFEKWWLSSIGLKRSIYGLILNFSIKILKIPIKI